jgi:hypothetical protein
MASGLVAASDLEQFTSEGGNGARPNNGQQRLKEEGQKIYAYEVSYYEEHSSQHLLDLGLGDHLLQQEVHLRPGARRHSRWKWPPRSWKSRSATSTGNGLWLSKWFQ